MFVNFYCLFENKFHKGYAPDNSYLYIGLLGYITIYFHGSCGNEL